MDFTLIIRSKIIIKAYAGWINSSSRVLDVGCGNAVVTEQLSRYFGCFIIGTDILDYRRRDIPFKIMTNENKLPFKDDEFDICMFNDALHHCDDQEGLLREASRVAQNVLLFEMEPTISAKIMEIVMNQIHNPKMNIPFNLKTAQQWVEYFKKQDYIFEYRRVSKPFVLFPFRNFAFNLKRGH